MDTKKKENVFNQAYQLEARLPSDTPLPQHLFAIDLPQVMQAQGVMRGLLYMRAVKIRQELAEVGKKYGIAPN